MNMDMNHINKACNSNFMFIRNEELEHKTGHNVQPCQCCHKVSNEWNGVKYFVMFSFDS